MFSEEQRNACPYIQDARCLKVNRRCVRSGVRSPCVCYGQDWRRRCIQYALVCGYLVARMLLLTVFFFWKATCYTVMVLYCTRVHQLDVYCHSTVLLLFWILSYLRVKETVIVWLILFGCFRVKLRGSVWVGFLRQFQILGRGVFMTGGVSQVCQRSCWGR